MYILEGNIGVGKSTFLTLLEHHCPTIEVVPEPKDNWATHQDGQSLLENFYTDPRRWAYTLETLAMISRVKDHMAEQKATSMARVVERSVFSGHYCFAFNDFAHGFLTTLEWEIYMKWVDFLVHQNCQPPQGFIYLRADPQVCYDRMRQRNRKGEGGVTMEYIQQIHDWHEKFLVAKDGLTPQLARTPVLILDANEDFQVDPAAFGRHAAHVEAFVAQTQGSRPSRSQAGVASTF